MFEPVFWWNPKTFSAWNLCFNHPQVFRKIRPSTIPNPGGNLGFSFELSRPRAHVWPLRVSVHLEMLRLEGKVTKHRKLLLGCADCVHEHSWEMGDHFSLVNDEQMRNKVGVIRTNQVTLMVGSQSFPRSLTASLPLKNQMLEDFLRDH